jgi:membrane protease YdiL (CAAX protease family)
MKRKVLFAIMPIFLIITTSFVFYFSSISIGKYQGYLIGFLFYWIFWCLFIPLLISKKKIFVFFKNEKPLFIKKNWWIIILFLSTIISPIFIYFLPEISKTPIILLLLSIPLATIHGFFEELFWRGFYIKEFPNNIIWGIVIPTIFFSLWHISPQFSIKDNNILLFLISTIPLGLTYGIVAFVTKSAKWSAIGHSISGIFTFSGLLAVSFYNTLI